MRFILNEDGNMIVLTKINKMVLIEITPKKTRINKTQTRRRTLNETQDGSHREVESDRIKNKRLLWFGNRPDSADVCWEQKFVVLMPSVLLPSVLLPSVLLPSVLLHSVLLPSVLLPSVLLTSVLLHSVLFHSVLMHSVRYNGCLKNGLLMDGLLMGGMLMGG